MRHLIFWGVVVWFVMDGGSHEASANPLLLRRSVFRIETTSQDRNFLNPWRFRTPDNASGSGFYIGRGRILTNAHVVANASYITVQRDSDSRAVPAWVEFMGHDVDLAILNVKDPDYFSGVDILNFASVPRLRSPVSTVGFPLGGDQISITDGIVSRISYRTYVHSNVHKHLLIQVDSAINPGNSGGPVFQGRNVVGVAFQSLTRAENTGYIIPVPVVQRFLTDVEDGRYDGVPDWGVETSDLFLTNHAAAGFYQMPKGEAKGVIVNEVKKWSPAFEKLKPDDILLSIQGKDIGLDGRVTFEGERVDFEVLYDLKQIGDVVRLEILRGGVKSEITFKADNSKPYPYMGKIYSRRPRYVVFGGIVFTTLSRGVAELWGEDWGRRAPLMIRLLLQSPHKMPSINEREEIVVITDTLAHTANSFVELGRSIVVDRVNGKTVKGLRHLNDILRASQEERLRIDFVDVDEPWVLGMNDLRAADGEILKRYSVSPAIWLEPLSVDGAIGKEDAKL